MKTIVVEDRVKQMYDDYEFLSESNTQIVFNRNDGVFVFGPKGLRNETGISYWSQNNPNTTYKSVGGYYTIASTVQTSSRRFSLDRLILLCVYFGKHDDTTGDCTITGSHYKFKE